MVKRKQYISLDIQAKSVGKWPYKMQKILTLRPAEVTKTVLMISHSLQNLTFQIKIHFLANFLQIYHTIVHGTYFQRHL